MMHLFQVIFLYIFYNLGRGTGYAKIVIDVVTKAIMAVGVKEGRQARDISINIWGVLVLRAVLVCNHKLEVAVVPTPSSIRDMKS